MSIISQKKKFIRSTLSYVNLFTEHFCHPRLTHCSLYSDPQPGWWVSSPRKPSSTFKTMEEIWFSTYLNLV